MGQQSSHKVEQGVATRQQIVETATRLFTANGFEGTAIEMILREAGISRGALYHHFAGKEAVFEAVLESVEASIPDRLLATVGDVSDPIELVRAGSQAWLRMARDPVIRQVTLIDAPAVVGWAKWREIDARYGFGLLKDALHAVAATSQIPDELVDSMAHMLLAALMEAALISATAPEGDPAVAHAEAAVDELLVRLLGAAAKDGSGQPRDSGGLP